jgi:DNA invertase Pin-like site-specific DNA recombinase
MQISGVFHDPGVSGMSADRPGWQAMMQLLKNTSVPHGVLIRDIARLARDFALSGEMEAACNRLGHTIIAVDGNGDARYPTPH